MAKRDCRVKTPTAKEEVVKTRQYTVGYASNRGKPNPSPQLTLSGKWLNDLGFTVDSNVTLTRQVGQLIIRLAEGE
ncbi:SymE family type I addiction module toxin [Providencia stuartii]|uniref:SymE family type I addiction module toxin n=1 Tax=Providencia stuartii TaxID=588 RepID=UPI00370B694E